MKKTAFTAFLIALLLMLSACSADDFGKKIEDFETRGYICRDSMGGALYFVTIRNNTDRAVFADGVAAAMDDRGNVLSGSTTSVNVIGPGEESCCYFYLDGGDFIDNIEYSFDYSSDISCMPVLWQLKTETEESDGAVTVRIKNDGELPAQQLEAYVLFFDSRGTVVSYNCGYVNSTGELLPGETTETVFESHADFASVKVFFSGGYFYY